MSKIITPWGPTGYLTYKRTYSRETNSGAKEEFTDTVERIISGAKNQLKVEFTSEEEIAARKYMLSLKGLPAGRFLWQLGTRTVKDLGLASLQNCAFTLVNEPIRPFTWTMDMLMLGSGVGYNIQREFVYELPKVKRAKIVRRDTKDADFIVPDSREGWVNLLERVLSAHFSGDGIKSYSTVCIRSKGASIKGFGGVASGPEVLCYGIEQINNVLNSRAGKKLRPIDCLDIMNIIGYVVVAGNVRRSAQLAIGDADDLQYLNAKRWDIGNIPNWRSMSNNSVVCNDFSLLPDDFWQGYQGNGEPYGLINLKLAQSVGRVSDGDLYPDPEVRGFNPCAEQGLADKETCCLAELFLPNIESYDELSKVSKTLYRIAKHSLYVKCHHKDTETIVHKNMRMGIGVTGYLQASEEKKQWLGKLYSELRDFDKEYSKARGWTESIKLTTVKPSGTLSLLAGTSPGCHPGYSRYFIRRISIASNNPLVDTVKQHGFKVVPKLNFDGSSDHNTSIAEFPCQYPEGTTLAKDMTAIDQLETVKRLQNEWSDNAVSCTVYYKKEELLKIKEWLAENYNNNIKTCSFLLHSEHGFKQAPYEEITEEKYKELLVGTTPITSGHVNEDDFDVEGCDSGACPIK